MEHPRNKDMDKEALNHMLREDARRRRRRLAEGVRDPVRGHSSPLRQEVDTPLPGCPRAWVPKTMTADAEYGSVGGDPTGWERLRCRHDFEFWCARCVTIKDKVTACYIPFVLNRPQRRVLEVLEGDRLAGRPIRMILLKARQWGGSTLVQIYMAWIQSCHRRNWHSLICAHVKDTAASIRGMYTTLLASYPPDLWEGDAAPAFKPFERTANVREIAGRGCRVTLGSAENADAVRGGDYAMAHLSETAFWPTTRLRSPGRFVQAVCGAIALMPLSLVVMESTANGVGNYFHREWLRCKDGRGDKHAVFVPWYGIDIYATPPPDRARLAASLDQTGRKLWEMGLDLDQIYWYWLKRREYASDEQLHAEYPTDDVEAFAATGSGVFSSADVERLRAGCREPQTGNLHHGAFLPDAAGCLQVWEFPKADQTYVVAVDVGGRSAGADWSVVAVLKTDGAGGEIVAQWRGHCDHDILARHAMAIGTWYGDALLAVESNTFESGGGGGGDSNLFILSRIGEEYPNVYRRTVYDTVGRTETSRVGFHTNRATKALIIAGLVEAVREGTLIERSAGACDELATYEQLAGGGYAAKSGYHDDMLMTRAIALHAAAGARKPRGNAGPPTHAGW